MPKVSRISGLQPTIVDKNLAPASSRPTKEAQELLTGLVNKNMLNSPFTRLINQGAIIVDYYSINENETTYTSVLNLTQDYKKTMRFDKISSFSLYGRGDETEIDDRGKDSERALSINLTMKQSIVLPNTIVPKENDHIVLLSHQNLAKPFKVTKVMPIKLIDRDAFLIEYSESTIFDIQGLEERIVNRFIFDASKVGTGMQCILPENQANLNNNLLAVIDELQSQYVEAFYSVEYDILGFSPTIGDIGTYAKDNTAEIYNHAQFVFNHYANDLMQQNKNIFKFGYDKNTLFLTNTYGFDRTLINYKTCIYEKLLNKDFKLNSENPPKGDEMLVTTPGAVIFDYSLNLRNLINDEYNDNYIPQYSYSIKFYLRERSDHLILTTMFNTGITLVDMLNTASFIDPTLKSCHVTYQLMHPVITKFLDKFMENDIEYICNNVKELHKLMVDKDNIDDYIGIPMILLVLDLIYRELNRDTNGSVWQRGLKK